MPLLQIQPVEIGDLQLAPLRWHHLPRPLHHRVVIEVEPGHRIAGAGAGGLLLDAQHPAVGGEVHHPIALRVAHRIGIHGGTLAAAIAHRQLGHQVVAMEEVVTQHQRRRGSRQKVGANQKGLGQAIRAGLHRIVDLHAPAAAIAEQALKGGLVHGRGDNQHLANSRQHQRAQRVIDHRFVIHRQQLFAHRLGDRVQPRAAAARQ